MPAVVVQWHLSGAEAMGLAGTGAGWSCGAIDLCLALFGTALGITRYAAACARRSLRPVSTPLTNTTPSRSYAASCSSVSVMRRPREGRDGMAVVHARRKRVRTIRPRKDCTPVFSHTTVSEL